MDVVVRPTTDRYATISGLPTVLPAWTDELTRALVEVGAAVVVEEPDRVVGEQRALELWLPALEITSALSIGVAGSLLAGAIDRFVHRRAVTPEKLHVRVHLRDGDSERLVELTGSPADIGAALRAVGNESS